MGCVDLAQKRGVRRAFCNGQGSVKNSIFTLLISFSLIGCQKPPSSHDTSSKEPYSIEGSLVQAIKKNQSSDWFESCDQQVASQQLEMAAALDERADSIAAFSKALPEDSRYRYLTLGPISVRQSKAPIVDKDTWESYSESWQDVYREFLKIKTSSIGQQWLSLNSRVRSLVMTDGFRLVYYSNMQLDKSSATWLLRAQEIVRQCLKDDKCSNLNGSGVQVFLTSNTIFNKYISEMSETLGVSERRDLLRRLLTRLEDDYADSFGFNKNAAIKRLNESEYELPLYSGAFVEVQDQLAEYITSVWKSEKSQLKIRWVTTEENEFSNIYKLISNLSWGERSFVRPSTKSIVLANGVRVRSIAHEIGHVLGFLDRYFEVWNPQQCEYLVQYNLGDLMSDPEAGVVTTDEWAQLDKEYPLK